MVAMPGATSMHELRAALHGATMIELMVAMAVIIVLPAIAFPGMAMARSDWDACEDDAFAYVHSLGMHRGDGDVDGSAASADRWIHLRSEP